MTSEKKITWTEQQRRAITARGGDVLVTASAGTGKTAVLSGRCVDIVSDESVCPDVWSILVLTFTDAAAEQMRSRIAEQLTTAFLESRDSHLRHQLVLLEGADISTIHSFCKRLISQYFYKLGLDPTFRVIDSDEQKLLKAEVLERTIDWAWQQSNLVQPLQQFLRGRQIRTKDGFLANIITLSNFLDCVVGQASWCERSISLAEAINPFATDLGREQKQILLEKLKVCQSQLRFAQKLEQELWTGTKWTEILEKDYIGLLKTWIELAEKDDLAGCARAIVSFKRVTLRRYNKMPEEVAAVIKRPVDEAVGTFKELQNLAILNPNYLEKISDSVGLQTKVVIELVRKFDQFYSQAKRALNCLDFADLERYALRLLSKEGDQDDNPLPSETALALRHKYKYIFVDEYQDINPVQQTILELLSGEENVFVVGDVKQSIYAFRGAEPGIFLRRIKSASTDAASQAGGLRIDLNYNFRSAKGILDFVNKVFSRIMTTPFAKIDYDESAMLRPSLDSKLEERPHGEDKPVVELHILDEQGKDTTEQGENEQVQLDNQISSIYTGRQLQAAMIAQRIRQMVGAETGKPEFQIYDKQSGRFRDVEYRDIVILMRSPSKRANDYVEILRMVAVPVRCEAAAGYFEATEISDCLCLLKVLENPQRDIELAAVLRSPFFKISDTDLAKIRLQGKKSESKSSKDKADSSIMNFYDCLVEYCDNGLDIRLAKKLREILGVIDKWRTLARHSDLSDLIWQIYRETGFLSFVSALPNGQARRANLLKLHDRAIQFEGFASNSGVVSLRRFVEFIEELQEAGVDWGFAEPEASSENAVRIISVHKSKGLEFPVVFLAELNSSFSKKDFQSDCLADIHETLGLQIIDRQANAKLSSLGHQVIAEKKLSVGLAEEMRILYVATTRARERLILTACEKRQNCRSVISNGFFFGDQTIPDWQLRSCQNHLEWVLYGLCDQRKLHKGFETGLEEKNLDDGLFSFRLYGQDEHKQLSEYIDGLKKSKLSDRRPRTKSSKKKQEQSKSLLSQVKKTLAWQYRFGDVPLLPAKQSVTQLTHPGDEYLRSDYSKVLQLKPRAILAAEPDMAGAIDPRMIGSATHLVISRLDLSRPVTQQAVKETKEKLIADNALSRAAAERVETEPIVAFFQSELGREATGADSIIWCEWPFTFALAAGEFIDSGGEQRATSNELIVVQGIIDMLVQTAEGLLVIDFKTDHISAEQAAERAGEYRRQLELYGKAVQAVFKVGAIDKWLYFLSPGCAIQI